MADYRQAGAGGILFMGLLDAQGKEMTYEQRKILYRAMFDNASVKVEMAELTLSKDKENYKKIKDALKELEEWLDQADKDYLASYEGHQTHDEAENKYTTLLGMILKNIWIIAIRGKLIESVTVTQDEV